MLSRKDLDSAELENVRVKVHPAVLSHGTLWEDHGYSYERTSGQKPQLIKDGRRIKCSTENHVQSLFIDNLFKLSCTHISDISAAGSSNSFFASRLSPSHKPAETRKHRTKMETTRPCGEPLSDLPDWIEEFTENPVDESVPAHKDAPASSSHDPSSEPQRKVVSGKHSIYTQFHPKDRNCDICMRTKITRLFAANALVIKYIEQIFFGELQTADHKVLSEGCESRNNHRYAVVVQDLATLCDTQARTARARRVSQESHNSALHSRLVSNVFQCTLSPFFVLREPPRLSSFLHHVVSYGTRCSFFLPVP